MSKLIPSLFLLLIYTGAFAQHETLPPADNDSILPLPELVLPQKTSKLYLDQYQKSLQNNPGLRLQNQQAGRTVPGSVPYATSRGTVYTMKPDNMPCLVPHMDQVANMPNNWPRTQPKSRMPNALPVEPLIPQEKGRRK